MKSINEQKDDTALQITDKDRKETIEAKRAAKTFLDTGEFSYDIRIKKVLSKLAIGHAVYELAEGYYLPYEEREIASVNYTFRSTIGETNWLNLDRIEPIGNMFYPEVGARLWQSLFVLVSKQRFCRLFFEEYGAHVCLQPDIRVFLVRKKEWASRPISLCRVVPSGFSKNP